jgi:hypothetical protein
VGIFLLFSVQSSSTNNIFARTEEAHSIKTVQPVNLNTMLSHAYPKGKKVVTKKIFLAFCKKINYFIESVYLTKSGL